MNALSFRHRVGSLSMYADASTILDNSFGSKSYVGSSRGALHAEPSGRAASRGSSPIGSIGSTLLCRGLRHNTTLTYLSLAGNAIDDDGGVAVCEALQVRASQCCGARRFC
jgi:hypothetical protein